MSRPKNKPWLLSEDGWRTLPEFPLYEITEDGDVRNRDTLRTLREVHNKTTGAYYYCLRKTRDSSTYCRNFWGLIYSAYPELDTGWTSLPDYPEYEVNTQGDVRHRRRMKVLPKTKSGATVLRQQGKRFHWRAEDKLLAENP